MKWEISRSSKLFKGDQGRKKREKKKDDVPITFLKELHFDLCS